GDGAFLADDTKVAPYELSGGWMRLDHVLKEGQDLGDGIQLAGVGARLIGEVFVGLLQKDPGSYLAASPNWRPTLPSRSPGTFTMVDLLRFAKLDPASRGQ
ncbi:hypothetical protein AB0K48_48755, partial [Nonomuraea sp. NPDC055795]